jgi:hypothetical protein
MSTLGEKKKNRWLMLKKFYEIANGQPNQIINMWEVGEKLGWDRETTNATYDYLQGERLLKAMTLGGGATITHEGVKEVEKAEAYPEKPTLHFPPMVEWEPIANPEHLKILRQGVEIWNQWRINNPAIKPDLREANLNKAYLREAILIKADLRGADLREANLRGTDLREADLRETNLRGADLREANLTEANLREANLAEANLRSADLRAARLINVNLDSANLTGAELWETQRAGWSIKGSICEYAYWDLEAKEKTSYHPSEFERLFAAQTKIRLFYKDGISPLEISTLPALIQHIVDYHPDCNLRFVRIHEDSGGAVVELAIEDTENFTSEQIKQLQAALQAEAQRKVEYQRQALIERETRLQLEGKIHQLDSFVDKLLLRQGNYEIISRQAGAVGPNAHAHDNTFNQLVNQINQSIDLSALAKELSELRQAIKDKQDSSPQADIALVKVAEAEIAASEKDTPKVIEHLKAAGKWTMDFAKEIGKDAVVAAIKQAMGML